MLQPSIVKQWNESDYDGLGMGLEQGEEESIQRFCGETYLKVQLEDQEANWRTIVPNCEFWHYWSWNWGFSFQSVSAILVINVAEFRTSEVALIRILILITLGTVNYSSVTNPLSSHLNLKYENTIVTTLPEQTAQENIST